MSPAAEGTSTPEKHATRIPIASRLHSPTVNPFPLGSNDDELEREQARAARAATNRRTSFVAAAAAPTSLPPLPSLLERDQIMDLLQNCLKLASENKINQKNTWELNLIDHLSVIIQSKSEDDDDDENNFQKASCSLEAGVKIYSLRVDSLHSEAYKVLGGINRAGTEENNENAADKNHAHGRTEQQEGLSRKDVERKLSPLATLEASFEALNMKKIDVAFSVDPLYHQTSAKFDEGGAKGLLLNNLGVYGNCHVLFDSFEVPEKFILNDSQNDKSELIDLSFAKDCLDQMMINLPKKDDISPTLRDIMDLFDENNHKQQNLNADDEQPAGHGETDDFYGTQLGDTSFGDADLNACDHDDHTSVIDDNSMIDETSFSTHLEETGDYSFQGFGTGAKIEEITVFLSYGLGFTSKANEWAGPDYWKYKKSKGLEHVPYSVEKQEQTTSKIKVKKTFSEFEFMKSLEKDVSIIFQAPKNPKSLILPTNRASCKFTLPEDFHYKPESLAKLFLLPDVMFLGKKARQSNVVDDLRVPTSWDQESINHDNFDDENSNDDLNDPGSLVRLPRQVNKVEVQYDKVSKQVDVHALKETLWKHILGTVDTKQQQQQQQKGWEDSDSDSNSVSVSLRQVLNQLLRQSDNSRQNEISPHLFFICLLHLANEHGLILLHSDDLDDVVIAVPQPSSFAKKR